MIYYRVMPGKTVVWLPAFLLLALATALSIGLWLSALNVKYRDVRYTIPFMTQFWMLATPVAYSSSLIPEPWRRWYGLNPMAGVVEGFRWALLGTGNVGPLLWVSLAAVLLLLMGGLFYFRRTESTFADIV
jgi:lipopolysaccharide transport system permease protein